MNFLKCALPIKISFRYVRDYSRRLKLKDLYFKRMEVGPEKPRHRSEFSNWNYESEVYAFGKRLGENFDSNLLRRAFVDKSYLTQVNNFNIPDNSILSKDGYDIVNRFTSSFLKQVFPHLPKEWINQIQDFLLSKETMAHVSGHLGTRDLILCDSIEVDLEVESNTLYAVVGALAKSQNQQTAHNFIKDFILTQLTTVHLCDLIKISRPFDLLTGVLRYHNKPDPEARLLRQSGVNSIFACYRIGVYSGEDMLGEASGEQIAEAEEEAFKQSLRNIFGIPENKSPIDFNIEYENKPMEEIVSEEEYFNCL